MIKKSNLLISTVNSSYMQIRRHLDANLSEQLMSLNLGKKFGGISEQLPQLINGLLSLISSKLKYLILQETSSKISVLIV